MTYEEFKTALFDEMKNQGAEAAEVYFGSGDAFDVNILEQEIDRFKYCVKFGLNLRVKYAGKDGYAYTEVFEDAEGLVARAIDNAKANSSQDEHPMQGACDYTPVSEQHPRICAMSEAERIDVVKRLEAACKAKDPRVKRLSYCELQTANNVTRVANTLGLNAEAESELAVMVVGVVMEEGDTMRSSYVYAMQDECLNIDAVADEVVRECAEKFGGSAVPSGKYRVLFRNKAVCDMLEMYADTFSADAAQKGLSLFAGREGEQVAAKCVSVTDDPRNEFYPHAFDDEGVPTSKKEIIKNGVLITLLHNLKTAKKAGRGAKAGNAGRSGISGALGVIPSNFFINAGEKTYEQLIAELGTGLIITELDGVYSGISSVTGEYSLGARGFYVKDGKVVSAVDSITVAGTLFDLLRNIEAVGNDLRFGLPELAAFGSPSLLVTDVAVAGE